MAAGAADSEAGLVAIYAALTYDVIAATNSSPQTTEINAAARSDTLMKWVYIGLGQAALFMVIGVVIQGYRKAPIWPPILGTLLGASIMWYSYYHAREAGLASNKPGTESYGG